MLRKAIIYILVIACLPVQIFGQKFSWVENVSDATNDKSVSTLYSNSAKQTIVGAYFDNSITIGSSSFISGGTRDNLVYLFDQNGNSVWSNTIHFKSTGSDDAMHGSYHDGTNWYLAGQVDGTDSVFDGSGSPIVTNYSTGNYIVSKISSTGNVDWVYPNSGTSYSMANSITGDGSGNVYVVGQFFDSLAVDTTLYARTGGDLFLLKIQTSPLQLQWARKITGPSTETAVEVLYDSTAQSVVVLGNFQDSLYAENLSTTGSSNSKDVFAVRYSSGGIIQSLSNIMNSNTDVEVLSADILTNGDYTISGRFNGSISGTSIVTNGGYDIVVAEYNSSNTRQWIRTYGGNANDQGDNVVLGNNGGVFVYGSYRSSLFAFGTTNITTSSTQDAFLMSFSTSGTELGAKGGLMTFSTDIVKTTALSFATGQLIIGSEYTGRIKFGSTTFTSAGGVNDMAVAKIIPTSVFCDINDTLSFDGNFTSRGNYFHLCDGDSGVITSLADTALTFDWRRVGTAGSLGNRYFLSVKDSGEYFVEITDVAKGCLDTSIVDTVKIDELDSVGMTINSMCIDAQSFSVTTFPTFTNFTTDSLIAKGVSFSRFNRYWPTIAGTGNDTVTFKHTGQNGCQNEITKVIEIFALPTISINTSNVSAYCQGEDRDTLNFATGTRMASYAYNLPATPGGIDADSVFRCDSLPAAFYTVHFEVTDSNGCLSDTTLLNFLTINAKPSVSLNPNQLSFCKNADPVISLGGGVPTNGIWNGVGITDSLLGSYDPGVSLYLQDTITYTVTNSNNCTDSAMTILDLDTVPDVNFVFNDTICASDQIYEMKATPHYQTGDSAIFYGHPAVDPNSNYFYPQISKVGIFKVNYYYRDNNKCEDTMSALIEVKALPNVSLPFVGSFCENEGKVDIRAEGSPSGGDYYYKSFFLDSGHLVTDTSYINVGLDTMYYTYTDSFNCVNTAFNSVNIKAKPELILNQSYFNSFCDNHDSVELSSLNLSVVSPPPPSGGFFTYDSSNETTHFDPGFYSSINLINRPALTYIYRDTAVGCADTMGIYPDVKLSPIVSIDHFGQACAGLDYSMTAKGALRWLWSTGDSTTTVTIVQDSADEYWVVGQQGICFDSAFATVALTPGEFITAIDDSVSLHKGTDIDFDVLSKLYSPDTIDLIGSFTVYTEPIEARTFSESEGVKEGINSILYYEPHIDYRRQDSALYEVCNISCPNICDSAKILYHVMGNPYEFIPNAFTPNGDGVNDFWVVPGIEAFPRNELAIYNRWGDLIFESQPYLNEWEGQTNTGFGGGKKVVDGTYFYVLKTNGGEPLKGIIEIKSR